MGGGEGKEEIGTGTTIYYALQIKSALTQADATVRLDFEFIIIFIRRGFINFSINGKNECI